VVWQARIQRDFANTRESTNRMVGGMDNVGIGTYPHGTKVNKVSIPVGKQKSSHLIHTSAPSLTENCLRLHFHPLLNIASARVSLFPRGHVEVHVLTEMVDKKLTQFECKLTWYQKHDIKLMVINLLTWLMKTNHLKVTRLWLHLD